MHCMASDAWMAISSARPFNTGKAPGWPRQTGQTLVLGGAPKPVGQPQKILVRVLSWTCTSSPITGSYFAISSGVATPNTPEAMLHFIKRDCSWWTVTETATSSLGLRQVDAEVFRVGFDLSLSEADELHRTFIAFRMPLFRSLPNLMRPPGHSDHELPASPLPTSDRKSMTRLSSSCLAQS